MARAVRACKACEFVDVGDGGVGDGDGDGVVAIVDVVLCSRSIDLGAHDDCIQILVGNNPLLQPNQFKFELSSNPEAPAHAPWRQIDRPPNYLP